MATKTKMKHVPTAKVVVLPAGVDAILTINQLVAAIGYSRRKIDQLIATDPGLKPDGYIGRNPRWRVATVNSWIESQIGPAKATGG
jgi:predicted DNA-binding transcriptional regulator AlpA